MTAETLRPNGQLSCSGLATCDFLEHDEDPDVSSVTIDATGNNVDTEYGVDFPTPSDNPTVGADLQEFRAGVIEFDSGQTGTPQARIELWENGSLVRAGTNTNVSTYAVLAFTWNANELATADGSLVQCKVIGTSTGGAPTVRNTVRIGHIEWDADVTAAPVTGDGSSAGTSAVTGDGVSTAEADGSSPGTGAATGDGASTAEADGSSAGLGTVTGDGTAILTGDGSSAGAATASGDGASTMAGDGVAAGTSTAAAVGQEAATDVTEGTGSAAGVSTVAGDGASIAATDGGAAGTVTVTAKAATSWLPSASVITTEWTPETPAPTNI